MAVIVRIPTPLRRLTQNQPEIEAEGDTIESLIENLRQTIRASKNASVMNPVIFVVLLIFISTTKIFAF